MVLGATQVASGWFVGFNEASLRGFYAASMRRAAVSQDGSSDHGVAVVTGIVLEAPGVILFPWLGKLAPGK